MFQWNSTVRSSYSNHITWSLNAHFSCPKITIPPVNNRHIMPTLLCKKRTSLSDTSGHTYCKQLLLESPGLAGFSAEWWTFHAKWPDLVMALILKKNYLKLYTETFDYNDEKRRAEITWHGDRPTRFCSVSFGSNNDAVIPPLPQTQTAAFENLYIVSDAS